MQATAKRSGTLPVYVQTERFRDFWEDAQELFPLHWKEVAVHQDKIPVDVDHDKYQRLDDAGMLFLVTCRTREKMVGYYLGFVANHPHYKTTLTLVQDMYFVLPGYRNGTGARLFIEAEKIARERGVRLMTASCKIHKNHSLFLETLGYLATDFTFTKVLD